nr:four helix bundle protein [Pedobacter panaciterrae]
MHQYKELKIWQKAMELVTRIYQVTREFPNVEKFGLVSQINRCAVSIPSNIAEGAGRNSEKEFVRFLAISHASSFELETQLIISRNINYLSNNNLNEFVEQITELQKMNFALQSRLKSSYNNKIQNVKNIEN